MTLNFWLKFRPEPRINLNLANEHHDLDPKIIFFSFSTRQSCSEKKLPSPSEGNKSLEIYLKKKH